MQRLTRAMEASLHLPVDRMRSDLFRNFSFLAMLGPPSLRLLMSCFQITRNVFAHMKTSYAAKACTKWCCQQFANKICLLIGRAATLLDGKSDYFSEAHIRRLLFSL